MPAEHRALAARVRDGESHVRWNDHPLVHLRNEDRIVPVEHRGGSYHEIDWLTGKQRHGVPLIDRDRDTGKFYSRLVGLKGGMRADEIEVMNVKLSERFTVQTTEPLLARAADIDERPFADLFDRHFTISVLDEATRFDARAFFGTLYQDSPTFRSLFNHAADSSAETAAPAVWKIMVGSYKRAITKFAQSVIEIPPDDVLSAERYIGNGVDYKPAQREQAYLHEMVHALTKERDPASTRALRNRGPIVYLTDKILSEAGYDFPQQVMYSRPPRDAALLKALRPHERPGYNWETVARAMEVENRYLDGIADAQAGAVRQTRILGEAVENRLTVKEVDAMHEELASSTQRPDDLPYFGDRFEAGFESAVDTQGHILRSKGVLGDIELFYGRLHARSKLFRRLFDAFDGARAPGVGQAKWKFVLPPEGAAGDPVAARFAHGVDETAKTVHLSGAPAYYLSNEGIARIERCRELTEAMVQILTRRGGVAEDLAHRNRGAVVWLADRILQEAGYPYPKRIAYATAAQSDTVAQEQLALYETVVRRAASAEDRHLDSLHPKRHRQVLACLGCRPRAHS